MPTAFNEIENIYVPNRLIFTPPFEFSCGYYLIEKVNDKFSGKLHAMIGKSFVQNHLQ